MRWAGSYGVEADFIAKSHCSVEFIPIDEVLVSHSEKNGKRSELLMGVHGALTCTVVDI
jgi:hypothetical protein